MTPRWRSLLYVPVTSERFVAKAHERGADAVILELEDAVAPSEKDRARALVREAAARIAEAGVDVLVRINRPWRLAVRDIEAAVDPNVRALVLPKVDSAEHVIGLAEVAASVEEKRGLPVGHILLFPRIEGPRGLLHVAEIANAHPRVVAIGLGSSDFTIATGMEAGGDGNVIASFQVVTAAIAAGRVPIGLVGSITEFGDLDAFRRVAERSPGRGGWWRSTSRRSPPARAPCSSTASSSTSRSTSRRSDFSRGS